MITDDYDRLPVKAHLDAEPCYEDHHRFKLKMDILMLM